MSRKSLVSILLGAGAGLAYLGTKRSPAKADKGAPGEREQARREVDETTRRYLMYVIMPVWSVAGFLDWLWHKQTKIETTSGVQESVMHLLMMVEVGTPILTGLFLEMNAGTLALMGAGWLMHEATVAWDVSYSLSRRKIYAREQHTHSYMQSIPFNVLATMACMYPEQSLALVGMGPEKPDFKLRFRKAPVPLMDFAIIVACMGAVSFLPHVEELWRCYQAQQRGEAGSEVPECARELYAS